MKKINSQKGITLVALVITIIILLILAGITISQLIGKGLVEKAQLAGEETLKQTATEKINFKITGIEMEIWAEKQRMPTLQNLADEFCNDNDFQYVELTKQKTSSILPAIIVGNNESIFVKLKDYEYEFEIDKNLRLASIDGEDVQKDTNQDNEDADTNVGGNSTKINDFEVIISKSGGNYIDINVKEEVTTNDGSNIVGYVFFIDNKAVDVSKNTSYRYSNLEARKSYNVYIAAIDDEGKMKASSNQVPGSPNIKLQRLADKCSIGDYVQYSANNVSKWRVWNINDDKTVQIISAYAIESYNPKSSYANMEKYLGNNENWKKYENSFAVAGSALGGTTKELYERNYNICLDVCKYTWISGARNLALFSKRDATRPWTVATTGVIYTGGDDGNNNYSLRPVVTLKSDVFVDQDEIYDSSTGWKIE